MRAFAIAIILLLSPVVALAQTAQQPAPSLSETVPMPEPRAMELSFYRVAAISVGAVAGVIAVNIASGGMITPILAAGMVDVAPVVAATPAAVPVVATGSVDYLATAAETAVVAIGAVVGGYVGNWLYGN
jgi:hypothetical protein